MKIVLYRPQIPQNTGNIVRTCHATGSGLILVRPLGFSTSNRRLKRAGLDYWEGVSVEEVDDLEKCLPSSFYFFSSKVTTPYTEVIYGEDNWLIFGSETAGLPPSFFQKWPDRFFTIPMIPGTRCLNLSNAVAVVIYEAKRQLSLHQLQKTCKYPSYQQRGD